MKAEEVTQMVQAAIPDAQVSVDGEGCNFTLIVVSEAFRNVSLVQRQRMVMAPFKDKISSGELHALSVKALLPEDK